MNTVSDKVVRPLASIRAKTFRGGRPILRENWLKLIRRFQKLRFPISYTLVAPNEKVQLSRIGTIGSPLRVFQ